MHFCQPLCILVLLLKYTSGAFITKRWTHMHWIARVWYMRSWLPQPQNTRSDLQSLEHKREIMLFLNSQLCFNPTQQWVLYYNQRYGYTCITCCLTSPQHIFSYSHTKITNTYFHYIDTNTHAWLSNTQPDTKVPTPHTPHPSLHSTDYSLWSSVPSACSLCARMRRCWWVLPVNSAVTDKLIDQSIE